MVEKLRVSPLQMALAAASLTKNGIRPSPRLTLAVNTQADGWVILPASGEPITALNAIAAQNAASALAMEEKPFWEYNSTIVDPKSPISWYLAGTLPSWQGVPLVVVVLLEENDPQQASLIGRSVLEKAIQP
jgi:hypothetical protein